MCRKRHGLAVCSSRAANSLFGATLSAGTAACIIISRGHKAAADGQAEELPRSLPEAAAPEAKRSCFATTLYK